MKKTALLSLMVLLTGCSTVRLFIPMSMVDMAKTAEGEFYVKDSLRNWNDFTNEVELSFQKELRGDEFWYRHYTSTNPPKTWAEGWGYNIRQMREGKPVLYENPGRQIDYINRRREELGLPVAVEK